ncbi:hypothetical protein MRX96_001154 [Rhipicephalus microplus]
MRSREERRVCTVGGGTIRFRSQVHGSTSEWRAESFQGTYFRLYWDTPASTAMRERSAFLSNKETFPSICAPLQTTLRASQTGAHALVTLVAPGNPEIECPHNGLAQLCCRSSIQARVLRHKHAVAGGAMVATSRRSCARETRPLRVATERRVDLDGVTRCAPLRQAGECPAYYRR